MKPEALPTEDLVPIKPEAESTSSELAFMDTSKWTQLQRVAKAMAIAPLTPEHLRGRSKAGRFTPYSEQEVIANCIQVCEQASRWDVSPFSIMKECYVVNGSLAWQGKTAAAVVNKNAGLEGPLRYEYKGSFEDGDLTCTAIGTFKGTTNEVRVEVELVAMRTDNQMYKSASKAKQKLAYDAALWWGRRVAPHVLLGITTVDDLDRIAAVEVEDAPEQVEVAASAALDVFASSAKEVEVEAVEESTPAVEEIRGKRKGKVEPKEGFAPASSEVRKKPASAGVRKRPVSSEVRKSLYALGAKVSVGTQAVEALAIDLAGVAWSRLDKAGAEIITRYLLDVAEQSE